MKDLKVYDGVAWQSLQGQPGANGADGLGFNPVGEWAACTDYNVRDVVTYRGSSYVQIAGPGDACVPPDSDPDAWQLLAAAGAEGPSAVSTDAGNTLALGSDGLLFTTAPPDSDAYVWCKHGDDIQAKYNQAKALTPNGRPLSADNRATLVMLPGQYKSPTYINGDGDEVEDSFNLDASYVDVVGIGAVRLGVGCIPAVRIVGNAVSSVAVSAQDIRVSGLWCKDEFQDGGHPLQVFTDCRSFSGGFNGGSGTYINCEIRGEGFAPYGNASGTFTNCKAGDGCFASYGNASGTFKNCLAGDYSYGSSGNASGTFVDCRGGKRSFAGGDYDEGSDVNVLSGTCFNCDGGAYSFGTVGTVAASARLVSCRGGVLSFGGTMEAGAVFRYCLDADFNEVPSP